MKHFKFLLTSLLLLISFFCTSVRSQSLIDVTTLDGVISAQYYDSPSGEDYENLIDKSPMTKYLTFHSEGYIQFTAPSKYIVTRYTVTSANDYSERDPMNWTLYGSNDTINWTPIDSQSNQTFANRFQTNTYNFSNNAPFQSYRLDMINQSGSILQLSEWAVYGVPAKGCVDLQNITFFGGTAIAEYKDSGTEAENIVDHLWGTKYVTAHSSGWVEYKADYPNLYIVSKYTITSADNASQDDPKSWTLEASNDNAKWTNLDIQTDQTFSERNQELKYTFNNSTAFRYYRLNVGANNGGDSLQLAELKLYGLKSTADSLPNANFTANQTTIITGDSVAFANLSQNATSYLWTFPGGIPSTSIAKNPTVRYDSAGTFDVTLSVSNGINSDNLTKPAYISVLAINKVQIADSIRNEFLFCWDNYKTYAWGYDELDPLTKSGYNWYSVPLYFTPVDALDTMVLMGFTTEADATRKFIDANLSFNKNITVSGFEITIRFLGGLISSYELTGDPKLLSLAKDLGNRLLKEFNSPTGMPYGDINLATGDVGRQVTNPAEIGTRLVEFGALSKLTGDTVYYNTAKRALLKLYSLRSRLNLVGNAIDVTTGQWDGTDCSVGGGIDSYFEYLIKSALLFHDKDCMSMWQTSLKAINVYLRDSTSTGIWYGHADMNTGQRTGTDYGSLDAFWCDPLCLGGDLNDAIALGESNFKMWNLYGIEPEGFDYGTMSATSTGYYLRPEIMESVYYLYHFTQNPRYLLMGKVFFDNLVKYCRTNYGYVQLANVITKQQTNGMPSYFMAETMKYLYLIFAPPSTINWNTTIFNTEAHPIQDTWDTLGIDSSRGPTGYALYQNFPNPFNPDTNFRFHLAKPGHVMLKIYNVLGQFVETVIDGQMAAGQYTIPFSATGFASGVYFYRLQTDGFASAEKMVYVK